MAKEMIAKKAKRKCMVRGCKNIDTYACSLTRESGNTPIICSECAAKFSAAIKKAKAEEAKSPAKTISGPPPLFYFSPEQTKKDKAKTKENTPPDNDDPNNDEKFICQYCGFECKNKLGLSSHERSCKQKPPESNGQTGSDKEQNESKQDE